jgi:hypothetical protein
MRMEIAADGGWERLARRIAGLLDPDRQEWPEPEVTDIEDYRHGVRLLPDGSREPLSLPETTMLRFIYADGSRLVLCPSGTAATVRVYSLQRARAVRPRRTPSALEARRAGCCVRKRLPCWLRSARAQALFVWAYKG